MINVLGSKNRVCGGLTRRELLRAGGLSLFGMSLETLLRAEQAQTPQPARGKAKSVILLYLFGGPAVQETFDPKPKAPLELRGEFGSIATSVPGVHFCEHLPQMAKWMNRSSLIRSATHEMNDHSAGILHTMTGAPPERLESLVPILKSQWPSMNAVVEYLDRKRRRTTPASVWMPCYPGWGQKIRRPGPFAGFLGQPWNPLITDCEITNPFEQKGDYDIERHPEGIIRPPGTQLISDITVDRLQGRRKLIEQLHTQVTHIGNSEYYSRFDDNQRRAFDILADTGAKESAWKAFDLSKESPAMRDRYGRYLYGEATLMARRLIERGVRFVTVSWDSFEKVGGDSPSWDTHGRHFPIMKDFRLPSLDQVYSALCEDLQERGLLDETLIVVMGEMGRTPKINRMGGRDHWSYVYNVLLTGAGVKHGYVHGSSDDQAQRITSDPVTPADIVATIYAAMGIDPSTTLTDMDGRVHTLTPDGKVIREVVS